MNNMILGRYIPGNSIIHQLDPRGKLLSMFLFIFLLFWANNLQTNLLLFGFIFVLMYLTRISVSFYVKGLKSMIFIIAFRQINRYIHCKSTADVNLAAHCYISVM